jgi:hypothetical protein
MSNNGRPPDPSPQELQLFDENMRKVPFEDLARYVGKHVAWSLDGTRIVASGNDVKEVNDKVVAAGIPPHRVVFDYIDDPDISYLG